MMDVLLTIQNRTRQRAKAKPTLSFYAASDDVLALVFLFLDVASLGTAELVCVHFQSAAQLVWKEWSIQATKFRDDRIITQEDGNKAATPKSIVRKSQLARKHCEQQASVVREYFFDRRGMEDGGDSGDIQGFSRLPRLHTSVLLPKFVDKYDFFVWMVLIRRSAGSSITSSQHREESTLGNIRVLFEGFLTPTFDHSKGSKYVKLVWSTRQLYKQQLLSKWTSYEKYLKQCSRKEISQDQCFQELFVDGAEIPEVTISAVGRGSGGKPRLLFVTGGLKMDCSPTSRNDSGAIILMDRISEQHPMLTHHFGIVPKISLTLRPDENLECMDCMELDVVSGSTR